MSGIETAVGDLRTIIWFLGIIAVAVVAMAAIFAVLAKNLLSIARTAQATRQAVARHQELEDLLATGQNVAAKHSALEWLASEPRRVDAHWALARAHHQCGELVDARRTLEALLKIAPEEHYRADAWLRLLEQQFAEQKPRAV